MSEERQTPVRNRFDVGGRRFIVTGASRGLGRGIALGLLEAGATIVGMGREARTLAETGEQAGVGKDRFEAIAADLSNDAGIDAAHERAWASGPVHGVVHAAGNQLRKPAIEVSREEWRSITKVQLETPFFLSTAIARRQIESGIAGCHIFIGSLTSHLGIPTVSPYAASKSGILGLTRTLAAEWASHGIRCNAICPGYFHTELTDSLFADPEKVDRMLRRIPLGRFGVADDLVGAAIFLLSDASAYITGQPINVDGGWLAT
jgi:2-deoxy-D-gluconate 3-dehydrogenase